MKINFGLLIACTSCLLAGGLIPAMLARSQDSGATPPCVPQEFSAPPPQAASPTPSYFDVDWRGVANFVAPNITQHFSGDQSQTAASAEWLSPIGAAVDLRIQTVSRMRYLAQGGAGQNVESIYRVLGRPTRVDLDNSTKQVAIAYWETPHGQIIGVVAESGDHYLAVKVN